MKTNISEHIKSELSQRTLKPSENAWEKLSKMLDEEKPKAKTISFTKWKMFLVAASITVFFTVLGLILIQQPAAENTIQVVGSEINSNEVNVINPQIIPEEIHPKENQVNSNPNSEKSEVQLAVIPVKTEKKSNPVQKTEFIAQLPEIQNQEEIAAVGNPEPESKPEKQKTNFVNPDMLLYSVENNQAITESNSNTRLVLFDFNK
ncbi:MAG: hypothetical protein WCY25_07220 [Moheibacter sp.]